MIPLIVLFLIPTYYIARSKGYNALLVCVVSGLVAMFMPYILSFLKGRPILPIMDVTVPLLVLAIVWLLPKRRGAPGKEYLTIRFTCPECGDDVSFKRHEEGRAVLCPACGEIITVPLDKYSPSSPIEKHQRPPPGGGPVCYDSFANEMAALDAQARLESSGIPTELVNDTAGGALPQLSVGQGFRIMIDAKDWDRAVQAGQKANQAIESDGVR